MPPKKRKRPPNSGKINPLTRTDEAVHNESGMQQPVDEPQINICKDEEEEDDGGIPTLPNRSLPLRNKPLEGGKMPEEDEKVPQDSIKKITRLEDAPLGSQVLYLAWLLFPVGFLQAINANNQNLATRLGATKIGESSSIERFILKMRNLQALIPFATISFIALVIPPELVAVLSAYIMPNKLFIS